MKRLFSKKSIIIFVIVVILISGGTFAWNYYMNMKSGKSEAKQNQDEIKSINEELSIDESKDLKDPEYYSEAKIYDIMHRMSNTKIIAENNKIWGELPIDNEEMKNLRLIIEKVNYEDREYLLEVLSRWESGDFSQADKEHNYFW